MDVNYINSNETKVRHLQEIMLSVGNKIEQANTHIETTLKKFGLHIDQEGYQCISNYVNRAKKKVIEVQPSLQHCGRELGLMADKLLALKKIDGPNNSENGSYKAIRNNSNSPYGMAGDAGLDPAFPNTNIQGLQSTEQKWNKIGDAFVFNTPETTGQYLNSDQGNADANFKGTCGICSCQNVLNLAGVNVGEKELIDYAKTHRDPYKPNGQALCSHSGHPDENGGTNAADRKVLLAAFGIPSKLEFPTMNNIVQNVEEGKGVIASVHAGKLWNCYLGTDDDYHAVTITSVERNTIGEVVAVYICDSGRNGQDYSKRYDVATFRKALTGNPLNVTNIVIR